MESKCKILFPERRKHILAWNVILRIDRKIRCKGLGFRDEEDPQKIKKN